MEGSNALSIFKQMPENKAQIESFIRSAEQEITSGFYNPLEVEKQLKIMEELIKGIRSNKNVREQLLLELDKYKEKTVSAFGVEFTKSSRSTYDYSTCNDFELQEMQEQADRLNEKIKQRQEMLKHVEPQTVLSSDGAYLCPPSIKSTEVISIKIK